MLFFRPIARLPRGDEGEASQDKSLFDRSHKKTRPDNLPGRAIAAFSVFSLGPFDDLETGELLPLPLLQHAGDKADIFFAAGDGRTKTVRQLVTAASDGATAALAAAEYIRSV